jgi:hypothetical protein
MARWSYNTHYLIIFLQQTQNLTIASFQKITQCIVKVAQTVAKNEECQIMHIKAQSQSLRNIHTITFETVECFNIAF